MQIVLLLFGQVHDLTAVRGDLEVVRIDFSIHDQRSIESDQRAACDRHAVELLGLEELLKHDVRTVRTDPEPTPQRRGTRFQLDMCSAVDGHAVETLS
ncbi:MAG: hypothetical protein PVG32_15625 [Anaerolineales bacterium]